MAPVAMQEAGMLSDSVGFTLGDLPMLDNLKTVVLTDHLLRGINFSFSDFLCTVLASFGI